MNAMPHQQRLRRFDKPDNWTGAALAATLWLTLFLGIVIATVGSELMQQGIRLAGRY